MATEGGAKAMKGGSSNRGPNGIAEKFTGIGEMGKCRECMFGPFLRDENGHSENVLLDSGNPGCSRAGPVYKRQQTEATSRRIVDYAGVNSEDGFVVIDVRTTKETVRRLVEAIYEERGALVDDIRGLDGADVFLKGLFIDGDFAPQFRLLGFTGSGIELKAANGWVIENVKRYPSFGEVPLEDRARIAAKEVRSALDQVIFDKEREHTIHQKYGTLWGFSKEEVLRKQQEEAGGNLVTIGPPPDIEPVVDAVSEVFGGEKKEPLSERTCGCGADLVLIFNWPEEIGNSVEKGDLPATGEIEYLMALHDMVVKADRPPSDYDDWSAVTPGTWKRLGREKAEREGLSQYWRVCIMRGCYELINDDFRGHGTPADVLKEVAWAWGMPREEFERTADQAQYFTKPGRLTECRS